MSGILAGAAVGAGLVAVATSKYGVAAISDSAAYISTARNVASGRGFVGWNGDPYVMWPPLYPGVLAIFEMAGLDALIAARWLNAALHAALACVAGLALREIVHNGAIAVLVAWAVVMSPVLLDEAIAVMSEPLFIFLVVSCLIVVAGHLERPRMRTLLAAAMLAALAWLTRYAGFALVSTVCLLLLVRRGRSRWTSLGDATLFGAIASAPMVAWLLRNYLVSATITGVRQDSPYSFAYLAELALQRIGQWFLPPRAGTSMAAVLGVVVIGAAAGVIGRTVLSASESRSTLPQWWDTPKQRSEVVFSAFTLIYVASVILLLSLSFATDDPRRVLAPAVPSSLMLLGMLSAHMRQRRRHLFAIVLVGALLFVWPARYTLGLLRYTRENGAGGVASKQWQQSGMIAHLKYRAHSLRQDRAVIYSNEPTAIYLLTGLQPVLWLPPHDDPYSPVPPRQALASFARDLPRQYPTYVALFDQALESFTYSRVLVEEALPVKRIHSTNDGILYRVDVDRANPGMAERVR